MNKLKKNCRIEIQIQTCPWKYPAGPEWETVATFYDYKAAAFYLVALVNDVDVVRDFYRIVEK
ncbi:MAG: hypothetical protein DRP65_10185 [Planctomycetota bacterium]|nr:MAG: hypothetical protein DRP65_10185 [Planctomycetota bacterium]